MSMLLRSASILRPSIACISTEFGMAGDGEPPVECVRGCDCIILKSFVIFQGGYNGDTIYIIMFFVHYRG